MGQNLYLRHTYRRQNLLKEFILEGFYLFASPFRLILEVLIRMNPGRRYFSLGHGITMVLILASVPFVVIRLIKTRSFDFPWDYMLHHFCTWYIFLLVVLWSLIKRQREINRDKRLNGFSRFSRAIGVLTPEFKMLLKKLPFEPTSRQREILVEPGFFLFCGLFLSLIGQYVGVALIVSALLYSISYFVAYRKADDFIQDTMDTIAANELFENEFLVGKDISDKSGFRILGDWPKDPTVRKSLSKLIVNSEEDIELAVR